MNGLFNPAGFGVWFGQARLLIDLVVVMWLVAIVNFSLLPGVLSAIGGLKPRRLGGLLGIPCSPFLHADWPHLLGNSAYHLIFGGMIVLRDASDLAIVTVNSAIVNGMILWLFGRTANYVGASGGDFWLYWLSDEFGGVLSRFLGDDFFVLMLLSLLWFLMPVDRLLANGGEFGFIHPIEVFEDKTHAALTR
jgi:membrane associated rhomboid family serine protease